MLKHATRRSFTGFYNHLLRKDYGTFVLAAGGADVHGMLLNLLALLLSLLALLIQKYKY